jgi:ribose transport system permease protein
LTPTHEATAEPLTAAPSRMRFSIAAARDYGIVLAFVVLFVSLSMASDAFLTTTNLLNILDQWAAVGIIACGSTLVLIAGGFDLSVAAVYALAGVVAAKTAGSLGPELGLLMGVLVGVAAGAANGLIATIGRINPIIATLASGIVIRGLALAISGGMLLTVKDEGFTTLGRDTLLGVKLSIWLLVVVIAATAFLLHKTVYGRYIYAAGGNAEAARLSGVRVDRVRTSMYIVSAVTAALGGLIVASRVATGQADVGVGLEFDVIAAIVIGGTSILGGAGAIWRTVLGVLILALIGNGFNLLNVDINYQRMIYGGLILAAVGMDAWSRKRT